MALYDAKAARKKAFDKRTEERLNKLKPALNTNNQPVTTPVTTPAPTPAPTQTKQPQVIRDQDTGKITFVETPGGKFIHGSSKDIKNIIEKKTEESKTPEGAVEASSTARANQVQELFNQQQGPTTDQQILGSEARGGIPLNPVLEAGIGRALPGAIGAVVGGAAGAVGGPLGIAAGAAVGGSIANALVSGVTAKLKKEQEQKIRVQYDSLGKSQNQINRMVRYVRMGGDPVVAWTEIQRQLAAIDRAEAEIKLTSMEDLSTFLSVDGGDELGNIRNWNEQVRPNIELLFLQAAQNPSGSQDPTDLLELENA